MTIRPLAAPPAADLRKSSASVSAANANGFGMEVSARQTRRPPNSSGLSVTAFASSSSVTLHCDQIKQAPMTWADSGRNRILHARARGARRECAPAISLGIARTAILPGVLELVGARRRAHYFQRVHRMARHDGGGKHILGT